MQKAQNSCFRQKESRMSNSVYKKFWYSLLVNLKNNLHVAQRLFSKKSQIASKCGKNKKEARKAQLSVSLMFLSHLWRHLWSIIMKKNQAAWILFVL